MNLRAKLLSLLMIAVLLLGSASSAFADGFDGISVSDSDVVSLKTSVFVPGTDGAEDRIVSLSDADDEVKNQVAAYSVKLVEEAHGDTEEKTTALSDDAALYLLPLLGTGKHIVVTPPDGYYVSSLSLTNGASAGAKKNILAVTDADIKSAEVTLTPNDLLFEDTTNQISTEFLSSNSADSNYRLNVELKPSPYIGADDNLTVRYTSGDLSYGGALVDESWPDNTFSCINRVFEVRPLLDSVLASAPETLQYDGLELVYPNGSRAAVTPGDVLVPYMDGCVLEAQWEQIDAPNRKEDPTPTDPIVLTVTASSDSKEYDGQPLTNSSYSLSGTVPEGYNLHVTVEGTITEIGEEINAITSVQLMDAENNDITNADYVSITTSNGTLQVLQRTLTLTAITGTVKTDGKTEVYASSLNTDDGTFQNGCKTEGLLNWHSISGNYVTGSGIKTFASNIAVDQVSITDADGNDVKGYYKIHTVPGTVTIDAPAPTGLPLTIITNSGTWTYDGSEHQLHEYQATGLQDGDTLDAVTFSDSSVITNAGTVYNEISSYKIISSDGTPVPDSKYTITWKQGSLEVKQRILTITAVTGTVRTDGKTVVSAASLSTEDGIYKNGYKQEGLLTGHTLSGDFVTGSDKKSFTSSIDSDRIAITDEDGSSVKGNYDIRTVSGIVTIETSQQAGLPLTITIKSGKWTYDGNAHTLHEYDVIGLKDGDVIDSATFKSSSTLTSVGKADNEIETVVIKSSDGDVVAAGKYAITYKAGTLQVTAKPLTITAVTGTIKTDGKTTVAASSLSTEDGTFKNGYKQEGLLSGHTLSGDFVTGSDTKSFTSGIDAAKVVIKDNDGNDVKGNYEIKTVAGKVTIEAPEETGIPLTITTKSGSWTYDGQPHSVPEYEAKGLKDGDVIAKVTFRKTSTITEAGTADNEIDSVVINTKDGKEVPAGKYAITYKNGSLEVKQKDLKITAISGTFTTDGTKVVTASSLATEDGTFRNGYKVEGLVSGHTLSGNFVTGSDSKTFQSNIDTSKVTVKDGDGKEMTKNYKITGVSGTITIVVPQKTNVPLTITAKSGSWVYDGTGHTLYEYEVSGLVDGDLIEKTTFKSSAKITNVGTQANEIEGVVIKTSTGASVAGNKYSITYKPGTLTITKFPITLTAESSSKDYDGKALVNKNVKATALANSSHKLSAGFEIKDANGNTIKNSPINVGIYTKKITNVVITDGSNDVTANYDVKTVDGTLTILAAGSSSTDTPGTAYHGGTYTLRSDAAYKDFQKLLIDGNEVSANNYTVKEGSTVITLKSSYVDTLRPGTHTYSIVSTSSTKSGTFIVSNRVRTGDESHIVLWIVLLVAAAIAIAVLLLYFRKLKKNEVPVKSKARPVVKEIPTYEPEKDTAVKKGPDDDVKIYAADGLDVDELLGADDPAGSVEEDNDPTKELMKDFDLDLDLFRDDTAENGASATVVDAAESIETVDCLENAETAEVTELEKVTYAGAHEIREPAEKNNGNTEDTIKSAEESADNGKKTIDEAVNAEEIDVEDIIEEFKNND